MKDRDPRHRLLAVATLVVLVASLVGCGATPSPSASRAASPQASASALPSGSAASAAPVDPLAVYGTIAGEVEQIRGLAPKRSVTPVLVDRAAMRAEITSDFDTSNPPDLIASDQAILRAFGLLGPSASLRDAKLALLAGEVAGAYDPNKGSLFVLSRSGTIGPTQRATYAHEFTHQLQDQDFGLATLGLDSRDQRDRGLARLALVEGDASATQADWVQEHLTPAELTQLLVDSADPIASRALNDAPAILRANALFPYQQGLVFAMGLIARGGFRAVDAAFARPPDSTEQVLHPEKYEAREEPVGVTIAAAQLARSLGAGWAPVAQDTLGELFLRTWLSTEGVGGAVATRAAAGWGGDRVLLLAGPSGADAVVLSSVWDTPTDADEFASAAMAAVGHVGPGGDVVHAQGSNRVAVLLGGDEAIRSTLEAALGF